MEKGTQANPPVVFERSAQPSQMPSPGTPPGNDRDHRAELSPAGRYSFAGLMVFRAS
jgi:hypothetical protein